MPEYSVAAIFSLLLVLSQILPVPAMGVRHSTIIRAEASGFHHVSTKSSSGTIFIAEPLLRHICHDDASRFLTTARRKAHEAAHTTHQKSFCIGKSSPRISRLLTFFRRRCLSPARENRQQYNFSFIDFMRAEARQGWGRHRSARRAHAEESVIVSLGAQPPYRRLLWRRAEYIEPPEAPSALYGFRQPPC